MGEYESPKDKIIRLEKKIDDLEIEIEAYKYCIQAVTRVYKERENAKRGLHPKKEHTGYLLVFTNSFDHRFNLNGVVRTEKLYQVVLQTPYTFDFDCYDAYNLIVNDLLFIDEEDDECILTRLGAEYFSDSKRYEELLECEFVAAREQIVEYELRRYKEEHGYIGYDTEDEIKKNVEYVELKYAFNMDVRRNGKEGYWEVSFQTNFPIETIPKNMRFRKGNKNETKNKDI